MRNTGEKSGKKEYVLLAVIVPLLMLLPVLISSQANGFCGFFGSEGDWYSQHVGAAENIRQMMLSEKTLLPYFSVAGGGSSIYDFAYYGLLRPDIIISYFMPDVEMKYIIAVYALLGASASAQLCFLWLQKNNLSRVVSFTSAMLLVCSACFFHSHHQIVFINYMPFLIGALMGIDRFLEKGKPLLMMSCIVMIFFHSFYYSFACLVAGLIYFIYKLSYTEYTFRQKIKITGTAFTAVCVSVLAAAVILLPTVLDILSTSKDAGIFAKETPELLDLSGKGLLYSAYCCGMTMFSLYCLIISLKKKRRRLMASLILVCVYCPLVWLALNGFLYSREKILIPLVPLIVRVCAETTQEIAEGKGEGIGTSVCTGCICMIVTYFFSRRAIILLDGVLMITWLVLGHISQEKIKKVLIPAVLIVPVCTSLTVNLNEKYLSAEDKRQSYFFRSEIRDFAQDDMYRFDYLANSYVNSNVAASGEIYKTAMYSSVRNDDYARFYYETMGNPIALRNRVVLMPASNPFFSYLMGIRYITAMENAMPEGYEPVLKRGKVALAENKDVLPICYGTSELMSQREYEKLSFPHNLAALAAETVVSREETDENSGTDYDSHFELCYEWHGKKEAELEHDKILSVPLKVSSAGKVAVISVNVDNPKGEELQMQINGVRNVLSSKSAPYPNENRNFRFVMTLPEDKTELDVDISKGTWEINSAEAWLIDKKYIFHDEIYMPARDRGEEKSPSTMFAGSVNMEKDGYFVTSFPYREGYRIQVNGHEVSGECVNTAFLGFRLEEGYSEIRIDFVPPGLEMARMLSVMGVIIFAMVLIWEVRKDGKVKETGKVKNAGTSKNAAR